MTCPFQFKGSSSNNNNKGLLQLTLGPGSHSSKSQGPLSQSSNSSLGDSQLLQRPPLSTLSHNRSLQPPGNRSSQGGLRQVSRPAPQCPHPHNLLDRLRLALLSPRTPVP